MNIIDFIKSKLAKKDNPDEIALLQSALAALTNEIGLPFGTYARVKHPWRAGNFWITGKKPSFINGHKWQYEVRNDEFQHIGEWKYQQEGGGLWFDECEIEKIGDKPMSNFLASVAATRQIGRRAGLWVANGDPGNTRALMYEGLPGAITCIYDYLGPNGVFEYKAAHPEVPIIVRIMHHQNWMQDPAGSAKSMAELVISKWPDMKVLNPYVYFWNELNLGPESGQQVPALDMREFYQAAASWTYEIADRVKQAVPEMKLVMPPWAYGHNEDGAPDDDGNPKNGWAGYDYFERCIRKYFDNTICFHAYWGDGRGRIADRLYDPELSSWHAFRWQRVLKLFETRYNMQCKIIIDEAGSFNAGHPDFFKDVKYYTEKCLSDERVKAVTYFLWYDAWDSAGNSKNDWVRNIPNLPNFIQRLRDLPDVEIALPQPEPEPQPEPQPEPEPTPEPEPQPEPEKPTLQVNYKSSNMTLVQGDTGRPGMRIVFTFWGNRQEVISGHKESLGEGGFEFVAFAGDHKIEIDGIEYDIEVREGKAAIISFSSEPEEMVILTSKKITKALAEQITNAFPDIFEKIQA